MVNEQDMRVRQMDKCDKYGCRGKLVFNGVTEQNASTYTVEGKCIECGQFLKYTRKLQLRNNVGD